MDVRLLSDILSILAVVTGVVLLDIGIERWVRQGGKQSEETFRKRQRRQVWFSLAVFLLSCILFLGIFLYYDYYDTDLTGSPPITQFLFLTFGLLFIGSSIKLLVLISRRLRERHYQF